MADAYGSLASRLWGSAPGLPSPRSSTSIPAHRLRLKKKADLIKEADRIVHEGGSHGLPITQTDRLNADGKQAIVIARTQPECRQAAIRERAYLADEVYSQEQALDSVREMAGQPGGSPQLKAILIRDSRIKVFCCFFSKQKASLASRRCQST